MPSRRQYSGNASAQTLTADLTSVASTATISSSTGWPDGSVGPFAVVIDRDTNSEEKCLCSGLSGSTLTFQTRGYDGTGGAAHTNGAAVELCLTAVDLDEANAHTSSVAGVHGISGNVVGTSDTQTLANKTLIDPTITDYTNANHDHTTVSNGGTLGMRWHVVGLSGSVGASIVTGNGDVELGFPHGLSAAPLGGVFANISTSSARITSHVCTGIDSTNVYFTFFNGSTNLTALTLSGSMLVATAT